MAAGAFVNVCRFLANAGGTGDFVVASAVAGFQTPASASAVNGTVYSYRAESTDLTQWEIGEGAYTSGTTTLARTTVHASSTGAKVNFSAAPQVAIVALSGDLYVKGNSAASTSVAGVVELATTTEAQTGTSSSLVLTPEDHTYAHRPIFIASVGTTAVTLDTWTRIVATESVDTDAYFSGGRFTPLVAGLYMVVLSGTADTDGKGGIAIYKNGAVVSSDTQSGSTTQTMECTTACIVSMNGSTDYLDSYGFSSLNAAPACTVTNFAAFRIGPS